MRDKRKKPSRSRAQPSRRPGRPEQRSEASAKPDKARADANRPPPRGKSVPGRDAERRGTPAADSPGTKRRSRRRRSGKARGPEQTRALPREGQRPPEREPAPADLDVANGDNDFAEEEAPELGLGSRVIAPNVRFDPGPSAPEPTPLSGPPRDVEAQIRALEARLDGLIRRATVPSEEPPPPSIREQVEDAAIGVVERITTRAAVSPEADAEPPALDAVASGYVERQWGREALRSRFEEVDDFGLDPAMEQKVRPALDLLYRRYFRIQVEGIEHVPGAGRAVIVANHGGTLPLDGAMLRTAMRLDHPSGRDLRWLAEDFVFYLPFAGVFLNRIGAVRACPENAERLLEKDALIAVFPEGVHGIKKLFSERYRLQRFGRGGYIRLCLRARAPLVPCAIIGAEETNPLLYRFESLATLFKLPYLPVTPTFPLLGPVGLLPAPTRWKLKFGEPISFDHYGPEAADDHVLIGRLSERVRAAIQGLIDSGLRERKSVWFG